MMAHNLQADRPTELIKTAWQSDSRITGDGYRASYDGSTHVVFELPAIDGFWHAQIDIEGRR